MIMKKNFVKTTLNVVMCELVNVIKLFKGCAFISCVWFSNKESMNDKLVAMKAADGKGRALKANNPLFNRLTAVSVGINLQLGIDYERSVNNRLKRNGISETFEPESLPWGRWFEYTNEKGETISTFPRLIEHKGNMYLRLYKAKNTNIRTAYYLDGQKVSFNSIKDYLKDDNHESGKQSALGLSKEEQSKPFTPRFDSIRVMKINHTTYNVVG
jgi:hypothetical protein